MCNFSCFSIPQYYLITELRNDTMNFNISQNTTGFSSIIFFKKYKITRSTSTSSQTNIFIFRDTLTGLSMSVRICFFAIQLLLAYRLNHYSSKNSIKSRILIREYNLSNSSMYDVLGDSQVHLVKNNNHLYLFLQFFFFKKNPHSFDRSALH